MGKDRPVGDIGRGDNEREREGERRNEEEVAWIRKRFHAE
jgi:hypothetical protein